MTNEAENLREFVNGRRQLDSIEQSAHIFSQLGNLNKTLININNKIATLNTTISSINSNISSMDSNIDYLKKAIHQSEENANKRLYNSKYCHTLESEINWINVNVFSFSKFIVDHYFFKGLWKKSS